MKNNKYFKHILIVLGLIMISTISWLSIYSLIDQIPAQNMIHFFVSNYVDEEKLHDELIAQFKEADLRKVAFTTAEPTSTYYASLFLSIGILESDLLILPQSILDDINMFDDFVIFNQQIIDDYHLDVALDYYQKDDNSYAIKVFDYDKQINLISSWFSFAQSENYYLLVNRNTINSGSYTNKNGPFSDRSFVILSYLLNEL